MNKQEFRNFCHREFTQRGFKKKKSMYYRKGEDLLCGIYLQKSMSDGYYVNYYFFIENYDDEKLYPTHYDADTYDRLCVLSKDTMDGEHFMDEFIAYELYTEEELKPYFDDTFERYIMPPIIKGKKYILEVQDFYLDSVRTFWPEKLDNLLERLKG